MTQQLLNALIDNHKCLELITFFLAMFLNIGILFWLGTRFLKTKLNHYQNFFTVMCLNISYLTTRILIPTKITPAIFVILLTISLYITCKTSIIKTFGYSCLLLLFNGGGDLLVGGLCVIDGSIGNFVFMNSYTIALASLSESIVPIIILVLRKEPILPPTNKEILLNGLMYICGILIVMVCMVNYFTNNMKLDDFLLFMGSSLMLFMLFYINTNIILKRHDDEKTLWQKQLEEIKRKGGNEQKISSADLDKLKYFWTMFEYEGSKIFGKK